MTLVASQVILRPVISEKSMDATQSHKYTFAVHDDANKLQIKQAVEELFKVKVLEVRTMIVRGHMRRMGRGYAKTQNWKKAIVDVKEGETIEFFGGEG